MNPYRNGAPRRRSWTAAAVGVCVAAALLAGLDMNLDRLGRYGVYTGVIVAGGPVYRLPSVEVVANRKTELARIERDEKRELAREAQARGRRPAA